MDDHKGTATICMKQVGKNPSELCSCCWFDDGKTHILPSTLGSFVSKREIESKKENDESQK